MKKSRRCFAAAAAALLLAACAPGGGGGEAGTDGPIRIAYMGILSGAEAVPDQTNALEVAIKEINAAGGIAGRQVEYKAFDIGVTPDVATKGTSLALEYQPTAILGYPVSSGLKSSVPSIKGAGVPVLHYSLGPLTSPQSLGYDRAFRMGPTNTQLMEAGNRYLIDDLHVKSMLVLHTQDASGTEGGQTLMADAQRQGIKAVERAVPPTASDLTEPVLAAQGLDAIWVVGYAQTAALAVKQAAQNNVHVPIMSLSSLGTAIANGLVPPSLVTKDTYVADLCGATLRAAPKSKQFVDSYTATYGKPPADNAVPANYDSLQLLKAAIEKAGTTDGAKVADALKTVTVDGACGTLKADPNNNMFRNVLVQHWPDGKPALAKVEENLPTDY